MESIKYGTLVAHRWVARKSIYTKLNGYRELSGAEDYDFLLRMTSAKLKYTNLENYFGDFVRFDRSGNTADSLGLRQKKIINYIYKLFVERQKTGMDSFSEENLKQATVTNIFWEKLYRFSGRFLFNAAKHKQNKNFIRMVAYCLLLLISPHQAAQLFKIIQYKLIIMRHQHKSARNRIS